MKIESGKFGTTIISDREVRRNLPVFEASSFPANTRFAISKASHGSFGLLVVLFGRGFYFVVRGSNA